VAIDHFKLNPKGLTGVDVGASTGGFTDVLLSQGAAKVYAVDVGQGQLAWKLRQDARVVVMEKTNIRHITREQIADPIQFIVCDVSFINLAKALPPILDLAEAGAWIAALIKPQFEVGKDEVGKGGIVKDETLHQRVCEDAQKFFEEKNWRVMGITDSPITGQDGNKEFLIVALKEAI
jgi:23S rRNA (cytidine1920-2'-O)/16S rRNA (cytidine1409-2'-O)-methyltransferase